MLGGLSVLAPSSALHGQVQPANASDTAALIASIQAVRRLERMGPLGVSDRPERQVNDEQAASLETSE